MRAFRPSSTPRREPITGTQAAALLKDLAFDAQPDLNPNTVLLAEEVEVPSLWEAAGIQLLGGKYNGPDGSTWKRTSLLFDGSGLVQLKDRAGGLIVASSAVVVDRACYISWTAGSGRIWGQIARISRAVDLTLVDSPPYYFRRMPFSIMLREVRGVITVERGDATAFNVWKNGEVLGTVRDDGDRLVIVDLSGQEIPTRP